MLFQCDYTGPLSVDIFLPDAGFPVRIDSLGSTKETEQNQEVVEEKTEKLLFEVIF
jgi:hypothetical protein